MAACEHGCPGRRCHGDTPCNDCPVLVEHTPSCGHRGRYQCYQVAKEPETIRCRASVTLQLPCSHSVKAECYRVGAADGRSAASHISAPLPVDTKMHLPHIRHHAGRGEAQGGAEPRLPLHEACHSAPGLPARGHRGVLADDRPTEHPMQGPVRQACQVRAQLQTAVCLSPRPCVRRAVHRRPGLWPQVPGQS